MIKLSVSILDKLQGKGFTVTVSREPINQKFDIQCLLFNNDYNKRHVII